MNDEFAKCVLDFLAQKAGKNSVGFSTWRLYSGEVEYEFFVECGVEDLFRRQPLKLQGRGNIVGISNDDHGEKPYAILLKHLLDFSKQGLAVCYEEFYDDGVFLEANTTLEKILVEMDLEGL